MTGGNMTEKTEIYYWIGIDGGGTKTSVVVRSQTENSWEFSVGAFNPNGQNRGQTINTLEQIVNQLKERLYLPNQCLGIGVGCAGISNPDVTVFLKEQFQRLGFYCRILFFGDQESALASVFSDGCGMILISGTGSVCFGRSKEGKTVRAGGWGHLIDDGGSGYAIAKDMFQAVVKAADKRAEPTILTQRLFQALHIEDIGGLIQYIYDSNRSKREIASLALLVAYAAEEGDVTALKIEKKAAQELYELVSCVISRMKNETRLAFAGSVLLNNKRIQKELTEKIRNNYPKIEIFTAEKSAAWGALALLECRTLKKKRPFAQQNERKNEKISGN